MTKLGVVSSPLCYFGWGPGCDSYTGGHVCNRGKGHRGQHACDCGAKSIKLVRKKSDDRRGTDA